MDDRLQGVMSAEELGALRSKYCDLNPSITLLCLDTLKDVSAIRAIVLEVVNSIAQSWRVVNFDNLYTSPQLLIQLKHLGLYGRGTVRKDRLHVPKVILMSTTQQAIAMRGDMVIAYERVNGIMACSWYDGNQVVLMSTADGTGVASVTRQINRKSVAVPAPSAIPQYNQYMQGVDRVDQLRARFSLADGHSFKKWYKKFAMAIIDFARVNAYQTQMLLSRQRGETPTHEDHHRRFVSSLCASLITGTWQHDHVSMQSNVPMVFSTDVDLATAFLSPETTRAPLTVTTPSRAPSPASLFSPRESCSKDVAPVTSVGNRSRIAHCVVCKFERNDQYKRKDTEYCVLHKVSCCTKNIKPIIPGSEHWALSEKATCWDKFHLHYVHKGVFSKTGKMHSSNALYIARQTFFNSLATSTTRPRDERAI